MIDTVRGVTHIAPPDEKGICGEPITQDGVIAVPVKVHAVVRMLALARCTDPVLPR